MRDSETLQTTRGTDTPASIDVIKEQKASRPDDERRMVRELSDSVRYALLADRMAIVLANRVEQMVSDAIRDELRTRLAHELRTTLSNAMLGVHPSHHAAGLLNEELGDAIEQRVRECLTAMFPEVLSARFPDAFRAATAGTEFSRRFGDAAVADLGDQVLAATEAAIRKRLDEGLRAAIRARVLEVARVRFTEAMSSAVGDRRLSPEEAADRVAATLGEAVENAVHERVLHAVMDRFRGIVTNSVHEATGERIGDWMSRAVQAAATRDAKPVVRSAASAASASADTLERLECAVRESLDDVLRERLDETIRHAIADQAEAKIIDVERLAAAIHRELADVVRDAVARAPIC